MARLQPTTPAPLLVAWLTGMTPHVAWASPSSFAALSPTARLWLQTIIPVAAITLVVLVAMLIYVWRRQQRRRAQAQAREAFHQLATQPPRPYFSSRPAMLTPARAGVSTAGAALETAEESELFFVPTMPSRRTRDTTPLPNDDVDRALVVMACPSCSRTFEVGVSFCPYDGHSCTREYRTLQDHAPSEIFAEDLTPVGVCHDCHHESAWGTTHSCPRTQTVCDTELVLGRFTAGEALQPDGPTTKICPECHRRHPHEHKHCVMDGAKLMSLD